MICPKCKHFIETKVRSLDQNEYYHSVIVDILCEYTGNSHDEMHEALKVMFLSKYVIVLNKNGEKEEVRIAGSTARLSTKEFVEFTRKIQTWASQDLNVYIPDPNKHLIKREE